MNVISGTDSFMSKGVTGEYSVRQNILLQEIANTRMYICTDTPTSKKSFSLSNSDHVQQLPYESYNCHAIKLVKFKKEDLQAIKSLNFFCSDKTVS